MKLLLLSIFFILFFSVQAQYNFYRGNLHSHSAFSDGNKENLLAYDTPAENYDFAKTALQFDFLGISEHNHSLAGMNLSNYNLGRAQAATSTTPTFVAMYGMEWGTISGGGHVIIYGVDSLMGWEAGNYDIFTPYQDYDSLFAQVRSRPNAFSYLGHPSTNHFDSIFYKPLNTVKDDAIIGSAVRSGPAFSTDTTYTNPSTGSYYARYKGLLGLGYHVGPTLDHDNHYTTFGKTTPARTVVLATSLTESNLVSAFQNRRFLCVR